MTFKPGADDVREAVSMKIIKKLLHEGADVVAYDPAAAPNAEEIFGGKIQYSPSVLDCLRGAKYCIVVTEWDEFRKLTYDFLRNTKNPVIINKRRIFKPTDFIHKGIEFMVVGLGRQLDKGK